MSKSAVEILGLKPDPMRSIWNNATVRDRRFICKAALVTDLKAENEHVIVVHSAANQTWDELKLNQQISIREACRRIASWSQKIGISEAFGKVAA